MGCTMDLCSHLSHHVNVRLAFLMCIVPEGVRAITSQSTGCEHTGPLQVQRDD